MYEHFLACYSTNIYRGMICSLKKGLKTVLKEFYFLVQTFRGTELCSIPQSVSHDDEIVIMCLAWYIKENM